MEHPLNRYKRHRSSITPSTSQQLKTGTTSLHTSTGRHALDDGFIPGRRLSAPSSPSTREDSSGEREPLDRELLDDNFSIFNDSKLYGSSKATNETTARSSRKNKNVRIQRPSNSTGSNLDSWLSSSPQSLLSSDSNNVHQQRASVWHRSPLRRQERTFTTQRQTERPVSSSLATNIFRTPSRTSTRQQQSEAPNNASQSPDHQHSDERRSKSRRTNSSHHVHEGSPHHASALPPPLLGQSSSAMFNNHATSQPSHQHHSQFTATQPQKSPSSFPPTQIQSQQPQASPQRHPSPSSSPPQYIDGIIPPPSKVTLGHPSAVSLGHPIYIPSLVTPNQPSSTSLPSPQSLNNNTHIQDTLQHPTSLLASSMVNDTPIPQISKEQKNPQPSTPPHSKRLSSTQTLQQQTKSSRTKSRRRSGGSSRFSAPLVTQSAPRSRKGSFRMRIPHLQSPTTSPTRSHPRLRNLEPLTHPRLLDSSSEPDIELTESSEAVGDLERIDHRMSQISGGYEDSITSRDDLTLSASQRRRRHIQQYYKRRQGHLQDFQRLARDVMLTNRNRSSIPPSSYFRSDTENSLQDVLDEDFLQHRTFLSPSRLRRRLRNHYQVWSPERYSSDRYNAHRQVLLQHDHIPPQRSICWDPLTQGYQAIPQDQEASSSNYYFVPHIRGDPSPLSHRLIPTTVVHHQQQFHNTIDGFDPNHYQHLQSDDGVVMELVNHPHRPLTSELPIQHVRISPRLNPSAYHPGLPRDVAARTPLHAPLMQQVDDHNHHVEEVTSNGVAQEVRRVDEQLRTPPTQRRHLQDTKGIRMDKDVVKPNSGMDKLSSDMRRELRGTTPPAPSVHLASRRRTMAQEIEEERKQQQQGGASSSEKRDSQRGRSSSSSALQLSASSGHRNTSERRRMSLGVTSEGTIDLDEDDNEAGPMIERSPIESIDGPSPSITPRIVPKSGSSAEVEETTEKSRTQTETLPQSSTSSLPTIHRSTIPSSSQRSIGIGMSSVHDSRSEQREQSERRELHGTDGHEGRVDDPIVEGSILGSGASGRGRRRLSYESVRQSRRGSNRDKESGHEVVEDRNEFNEDRREDYFGGSVIGDDYNDGIVHDDINDVDESLVLLDQEKSNERGTDGNTTMGVVDDRDGDKRRRVSVASFACQADLIDDYEGTVVAVGSDEEHQQIVPKKKKPKAKAKKKSTSERLKELGEQAQGRLLSDWNLGGVLPQPPLVFTPIEAYPYRRSLSVGDSTRQLTNGDDDEEASDGGNGRRRRYPRRHRLPPLRQWCGEHYEYERLPGTDYLSVVGVHLREGMPEKRMTAGDALKALRDEDKKEREQEKKYKATKKAIAKKGIRVQKKLVGEKSSSSLLSRRDSIVPIEKNKKRKKRDEGALFSETDEEDEEKDVNNGDDAVGDEEANDDNAIVPAMRGKQSGGKIFGWDELKFVEVDSPSGPFEVAMITSKENLYDLCEMHFHPMRYKGAERSSCQIIGHVQGSDDQCCLVMIGEKTSRRSDIEEVAKTAEVADDVAIDVSDGAMLLSWNGSFHIGAGVWYNFANLSETNKLVLTLTVLRSTTPKKPQQRQRRP